MFIDLYIIVTFLHFTRWEGLRQRSLSRQTSLHIKLMDLQRSEMQKLRTWMTETEDKISRSVSSIIYINFSFDEFSMRQPFTRFFFINSNNLPLSWACINMNRKIAILYSNRTTSIYFRQHHKMIFISPE